MLFGALSVELALANLMYRFNWELADGPKIEDLSMSEARGITIQMKFPLQLVPKHHFT